MNQRERYWRNSLIGIILVLGVILFDKFTPFLGGILGAFTAYVLLRKQSFRLINNGIKPSITALLMLLEAFLFFLIPLALAAWLLIIKLEHSDLNVAIIKSSFEQLAELVHQKTGFDLLNKNNIGGFISRLPEIGKWLMAGISSFALNAICMLLVLFFMLIEGKKMEAYLYGILPFSEKNKQEVLKRINTLVKSNAIGIPLLAVIQGTVALIGYLIFGVSSPVLFSFLTCFTTVIPLLGTSLVWFPLAVYFALMGNWFSAIGLALYCLLIVSNVDNLARFILQKKLANTHPLITIFGVIIGLSLFGFIGVIFGPILLSFFLLCVDMFKREYVETEETT